MTYIVLGGALNSTHSPVPLGRMTCGLKIKPGIVGLDWVGLGGFFIFQPGIVGPAGEPQQISAPGISPWTRGQ